MSQNAFCRAYCITTDVVRVDTCNDFEHEEWAVFIRQQLIKN